MYYYPQEYTYVYGDPHSVKLNHAESNTPNSIYHRYSPPAFKTVSQNFMNQSMRKPVLSDYEHTRDLWVPLTHSNIIPLHHMVQAHPMAQKNRHVVPIRRIMSARLPGQQWNGGTPRSYYPSMLSNSGDMPYFYDSNESKTQQVTRKLSDRKSSEREAKVVTRPKQPEPVRSVPAVTTMGAVPFANNQQQKFNLFQSTPKEDKKKDKKKDNKKVKLRKEDISLPSNFQHTAHLGWNQSTGYEQHVPDTNAVDDSVRDVIRAAGINPDDLKHDDLAYAKKFIENYKDPPRDLLNAWGDNNSPANSTTSVSSKSQSVNSPRGNYHGAVPPPPPVRRDYQPSGPNMGSIGSDHSINSSPRYYTSDNSSPKTSVAPVVKRPVFNPPPPPAKLNRPPPPPPMTMKIDRSAPPPPAPFSNGGYNLRQGSNNAAPPPPITPKHGNNTATSSAPPPPPLPPPGALKLAQTPSTNNTGNYEQQQTAPKPPPMQEPRGGLLAEIQAGRSLKPVEQASPTDNNPRDGLLAQIQRGTNLKHVDSDSIQQNRKSATTVSDAGGIAGALARALEERRKNMLVSDSESDGDNNDDEWDTD
uniref:CRIB domain-containing protein n=1 Tax=Rhabditophanes sp. KR3021 TaxID=114890 RepID=A0AC35U6P2_9BILA